VASSPRIEERRHAGRNNRSSRRGIGRQPPGGILLHLLAVVVTATWLVGPAAADTGSERATLSGSHGDHQFVAGSQVVVEAELSDDLFAAGGQVVVERSVAEDIIIAGGTLRREAIDANDVIAAGGRVDIGGNITDDLVLASGALHLDRDTVNGVDAWLAGGVLDVEGQIGGRLSASARSVRPNGTVKCDVEVSGRTIVVADGARLGGDLVYRSDREVDLAEGATIAGEVRWIEVEGDVFHRQR
jgi:cytoskeletal protein CcmA (bactofilin family)